MVPARLGSSGADGSAAGVDSRRASERPRPDPSVVGARAVRAVRGGSGAGADAVGAVNV